MGHNFVIREENVVDNHSGLYSFCRTEGQTPGFGLVRS